MVLFTLRKKISRKDAESEPHTRLRRYARVFDSVKQEKKERFSEIFGLHTWSESSSEHLIDVVFVHGLAGGSSTWASANGTFWPVDLLSKEFPEARILGFNYDASYKSLLAGRNTSSDNAERFMWALGRLKAAKGTKIPTIFVAHSLGGLVCESMLITASYHPVHRYIFESAIGIVFLGTPQIGSDLAGWSRLLQDLSRVTNPASNSSLISGLSNSSETWSKIQQEFFSIWRHKNKPRSILCVYETHATPGIAGLVVQPQSAIIPSFESVAAYTTHAGLAKCSTSHDTHYRSIVNAIHIWLREYTSNDGPKSAENHLHIPPSPEAGPASALGPRISKEIHFYSPETAGNTQGDPHVNSDSIVENTPETILGNSVQHLLEGGRYQEAEEIQRQLFESARLAYGPKDARTLVLKKNLGTIYYLRGLLVESECLLREVVEAIPKSVNLHEQSTIDAMSSLSSTLIGQGKLIEAETLQREVVETENLRKGPEHPDSLKELALYARILSQGGREQEASDLRKEIMSSTSNILGSDHPDTLRAQGEYALDLIKAGRLEEAQELQRMIAMKTFSVFGEEHPSAQRERELHVTILIALGQQTGNKSFTDEAAKLQEEVLYSLSRILGSEHPKTIESMELLATLKEAQGHHEAAIALEKRVVRLSNDVLGPEHPRTISSRQQLNMREATASARTTTG